LSKLSKTPEKVLEDITKWIHKINSLTIQKKDNPDSHFNIIILSNKPGLKRITVSYPKRSGDKILMGWGWRLLDMDIKAYAAIKDRDRKESIMNPIAMECKARKLGMRLIPEDIYRFEELKLYRYLHVDELDQSIFFSTMFDLWYMVQVIMEQFEKQNMSRAGFNPDEHI
jgi:hypothetical protein